MLCRKKFKWRCALVGRWLAVVAVSVPLVSVAQEKDTPGRELLEKPDRGARAALPGSSLPLQLVKRERIAFVGSGLGERMNQYGTFEALLHHRFKNEELLVRNFCRPADEVAIQQRPTDYTKLDDPLYIFGPDTLFCFFGANESFAGPEGVEKFKADYLKYLDAMTKRYPRDDSGAPSAALRIVIISPIAFEPTGDRFLPEGTKENANLKLYSTAAAEVAKQRGIAFVDLFTQTEPLFTKESGRQFTWNGLHLNEAGDRETALLLDAALFGGKTTADLESASFKKLREAVNDKAWVHFQDYRMLNGWYVYGGRRTLDHETFPREINKIRRMVAVRDGVIWAAAQGKEVKPDDSKTGELFVPKTGFGTKPYSEPKELKYLTPEEGIAAMTVPPGFEVQLVASEREFPELADVDQINFDGKGRLWASCMPTYPQWKPGDPRPNDRLLIFEDFDANGRARKCTTFYDKLICPTGFEFWNGGVLVVDEPRLLFLKDTNGDDKADVVIPLMDGWATDDTHHTIGAFEWSNGGLLHMLEGVSLSTTVETPWGPVRNNSTPGCYVMDPRSQKIRRFMTPGYGNPWCYVFDKWGQGFVGDGTTPQQHWDSPLSTAPYKGRKGLNPIFDGMGMRPNVGTEFLTTRQFPDEVQDLFVYACVINMHGLTTFKIGNDGAGFKGGRRMKSVDGKSTPDDMLTCTDANFRPVDPQIGPDGALYFGDWHTALLGHMQYSQRDPERDHSRGRLYRLVNKNKPLLKPVLQDGKPVAELLDQLKEYETRTRYRARRELGGRSTEEVVKAVRAWVAKLDSADKNHDLHLCEALWVQQWHHAVDVELLKKVLRAPTGEARAAATRVLADEWEFIPEAMKLIAPQATDEFARTRLEAIRALSFVPTKESVEIILTAAAKPRDYWIDYTLDMTMGALEKVWSPLLKSNDIAKDNPVGLAFLQEKGLQAKPEEAASAALKRVLAGGMKSKDAEKDYAMIAKASGSVDNGKAVARRICTACHKYFNEGIDYGPAFQGIGKRLSKEVIVQSIIDPNAKVDPAYTITNIETKDGQAMTGFLAKETDTEITMKLPGGVLMPFKKDQLKKRENLKQSSMPEGLGSTMSAQEFFDLVAFLSSQK